MSAQDLRERFFATPLVTRSLAASAWASVVLNVVTAGAFDDLVCASPHDIVRRGQVWRLVTSVLYVPGVISALFLSFILYRVCSGWERERGSLRMAHYFLLGVVGANAATALLAVLLAPFAPSLMAHTYVCAPGMQSALFVLCARIALGYPGPGVNLFGRSDLFVAAKRIRSYSSPPSSCSARTPWRRRARWVWASSGREVDCGASRPRTRASSSWSARARSGARRRSARLRVVRGGGPTMPSAGAPADPTARGFLQHVRENAFAFGDEPASDASRGNAGGPGGAFPLARGTAAGGSAEARGRGLARRRRAVRAGGGRRAVGFPGGGASPGNPWGRQNVHLSNPPRADPDPGGGAGGREKTREPKPEGAETGAFARGTRGGVRVRGGETPVAAGARRAVRREWRWRILIIRGSTLCDKNAVQ